MKNRKANFYAGPSALPFSVLEQLQQSIVDYHGIGLSLMETSHRSVEYDKVHNRAIDLVRDLLSIPDNFHILFLGGGATLQFAMVPMNFISKEASCDFIISGSWAKKAMADAKKIGSVNVLFDGKESKYSELPGSVECSPHASYLHITSNETIDGVQWQQFPNTGNVPLVADMSSDIMSRPLPMDLFGLIYAGAQKNLGPAGATMVIIRDDLLERCPDSLPAYLNYKTHAEKNSLYNTPPVLSIYALMLVLEWIQSEGGVKVMNERCKQKSSLIYNAIDTSEGFYRCNASTEFRSSMNVAFRLPSEPLEEKFIEEAENKGMIGLKGHRSVGGIRASLYNAVELSWVEALLEFMSDFRKNSGER